MIALYLGNSWGQNGGYTHSSYSSELILNLPQHQSPLIPRKNKVLWMKEPSKYNIILRYAHFHTPNKGA